MSNASPAVTLATVTLASLASLGSGCRSNDRGSASPVVEHPTAQLVAVLPMNEGFGPEDQDRYEQAIAPIAADHGMARTEAYTVSKYLGGDGPRHASTVGVWALEQPESMSRVMGDDRYLAHVERRDEIHDLPSAAMYMTREEFRGTPPAPGEAILVGLLVMNESHGFDDHHDYEMSISPTTERHGMRLFAEYRVLDKLSPSAPDAAAINFWALETPEALGKVMSDPEYQTHIEHRDAIHDMQATTMYFVAPR